MLGYSSIDDSVIPVGPPLHVIFQLNTAVVMWTLVRMKGRLLSHAAMDGQSGQAELVLSLVVMLHKGRGFKFVGLFRIV